ncbi:uncharacterized protein RSE6_04912 [Rhynchosporium secalis]|uniref:Uncharacterized protein n=1 Tax=Rhynchosporium secalis TaxID=38038 RepID=A0A1E1M6H4_RHYSE|nr:uncharacterized protein RSE6_04912 [Rhynchosporium secalis]
MCQTRKNQSSCRHTFVEDWVECDHHKRQVALDLAQHERHERCAFQTELIITGDFLCLNCKREQAKQIIQAQEDRQHKQEQARLTALLPVPAALQRAPTGFRALVRSVTATQENSTTRGLSRSNTELTRIANTTTHSMTGYQRQRWAWNRAVTRQRKLEDIQDREYKRESEAYREDSVNEFLRGGRQSSPPASEPQRTPDRRDEREDDEC